MQKTEVNYDKREAMVIYDVSMTGITALTMATELAGYPAAVKNEP